MVKNGKTEVPGLRPSPLKCLKVVFFVLLAVAIATAVYRLFLSGKEQPVKLEATSVLTDVADIAELSTAEFKYNGIAEIYSNAQRTDITCRVCYEAVVKTTIDLRKVQGRWDDENRTLILTPPPFELKSMLVNEGSMTILPSNSNVEMTQVLSVSLEDVEREAAQSQGLLEAARKNFESILQGLYKPVLKQRDYTLVIQWPDIDESEASHEEA